MTMPGFTAMAGVADDPRILGRVYRSVAAVRDGGVQPAHFPRRACTPACKAHYYGDCREGGGTYDECQYLARQYCCPRPSR